MSEELYIPRKGIGLEGVARDQLPILRSGDGFILLPDTGRLSIRGLRRIERNKAECKIKGKWARITKSATILADGNKIETWEVVKK